MFSHVHRCLCSASHVDVGSCIAAVSLFECRPCVVCHAFVVGITVCSVLLFCFKRSLFVHLFSFLIVDLTCVRERSGSRVCVFAMSCRLRVALDCVASWVCFEHVLCVDFVCSFVRSFICLFSSCDL